ncbi:MAG: iron ABC transporter permease [Planctomycetes bacterium]|nr:iron ABC transporter permease [Planctomycetota bacterium]
MSALTKRPLIALAILFIIALAVVVLRLLIDRPPGGELTLAWPEESYAKYRFTSAFVGVMIGASLAISGVLLQALLRNPLASPFILGLSSGAGLGVMIGMYLGYVFGIQFANDATGTAPAMVGAVFILLIVYLLGRRRGVLDPLSLVLVGVILSAMCGAGMMVLQYLVPDGLRGDLLIWMMGQIPQVLNNSQLIIVTTVCIAGLIVATIMGKAMDAATFSDDEARSIGLNLGPTRLAMFLLAGALAAVTVAIAGPIGFVGLIAPHAARLVVGPRHRILVIAAAAVGAILVVAADATSQAIDFGHGRLPVGVFTALIGGPAFIWLLRSGKGQV